jgi:CheY-like chemotaxis protein
VGQAYSSAPEGSTTAQPRHCTPQQARAGLAESAARCAEMLAEALGGCGGRVEKFRRDGWARPWPVGLEMLCYMLSHEAHHRGQVTTLIVDDEPLAREGLRLLRLSEDPEISVIWEAKDGREAVVSIQETRPDLVFLDVQMPEMNGFSVVQEVGAERMPGVVFVTAHDQFAIQAFEINAIDYLLKPVTEERFQNALARAKARLAAGPGDDTSREILEVLDMIASPRVLPLSALHLSLALPPINVVATSLVIHILMVGLPIALVVRRYSTWSSGSR